MFGLGAHWYVDLFLLVGTALPFLCGAGIRLARQGHLDRHRRWQRTLFIVFTVAILGLETGIRFGGAGEGLLDSRFHGSLWLRGAFAFHVLFAILTYGLWAYLVIRSGKLFGTELPGPWSHTHRRLGKITFAALSITALSAWVVYTLSFVF
jgi:uncharacterized membrane protein YozB (DUF420 family)